MLFLVEMDHLKSLAPPTPEAGKDFVERIIFPTLERAEQLIDAAAVRWMSASNRRCVPNSKVAWILWGLGDRTRG